MVYGHSADTPPNGRVSKLDLRNWPLYGCPCLESPPAGFSRFLLCASWTRRWQSTTSASTFTATEGTQGCDTGGPDWPSFPSPPVQNTADFHSTHHIAHSKLVICTEHRKHMKKQWHSKILSSCFLYKYFFLTHNRRKTICKWSLKQLLCHREAAGLQMASQSNICWRTQHLS